MKLKFKYQRFQADAAKAVCDVFAGQPYKMANYAIDLGTIEGQIQYSADYYTGVKNHTIELTDDVVLKHIKEIQRAQHIKPSNKLEKENQFGYNLTIEMETGVGKTYTYIKTMFELNKQYGWTKFIVVVPSVAIREGVHKSFEITQEHFAEDYGKKIRFFIYNSKNLTDIEHFASDSAINVMIINSQAFNAPQYDKNNKLKKTEGNRIYRKQDAFKSRSPIDVIAKTNPILIIDEPQSVEGVATKKGLKRFNALLTLRYSATHRKDSIYNMIYRLDAMEAYNKRLVKKIAVKGISVSGTTATDGYIYLQNINLYRDKNPTAHIGFDKKVAKSVRQVIHVLSIGDNLYAKSGGLEEYRNGYIITDIDGRENTVTFQNGKKLYIGDVEGIVNESQLRRIQIRETILSHIEKERELFHRGIKVLSLFFIDEVAKYRLYDPEQNGEYANIFEEEYADIINNLPSALFDQEKYLDFLKNTVAEKAHAGYFSKDKKGKMVDSKEERRTKESGDVDAYDLIMRNKERLLDRKEPVRFIFSHSALREGWDNPNVFQICTLKQSSAEVRKRQEVGRGLRLCVNAQGERMDVSALGEEVHDVNVLTVIASESYESFAKGLQTELAEIISDRPLKVDIQLFNEKIINTADGEAIVVTKDIAQTIYDSLLENGYVKKGEITDKYYDDKKTGFLCFDDEIADYKESIVNILDSVYDTKQLAPENARKNNVELHFRKDNFERKEFQALWKLIRPKSAYMVKFEGEELVKKAIAALNSKLHVSKIYVKITEGVMNSIKSKDVLQAGQAFDANKTKSAQLELTSNNAVKYDLVGKITEDTGLTRKTVVDILNGIEKSVFDKFKDNPEEFIMKAAELINEQKATVIVQHIAYNKLDVCYDSSLFTDPTIKGQKDVNAMKVEKHLYDYVVYDSPHTERPFAEELEKRDEVAVYVKLPRGFYINTPVGKYNPDWAIAFNEGAVKHIYFVAETKGDMSSLQLREVESAKISCARKHFAAISCDKVKYDVVNSYEELLKIVS
ncbi:type III restriction-modification system StyLTI enzyme res [Bacteroidales bacterium Barb4]|nr:type III restriction-modification system StyLTI enzyme res [Bacteroidales bacterium Barb4]